MDGKRISGGAACKAQERHDGGHLEKLRQGRALLEREASVRKKAHRHSNQKRNEITDGLGCAQRNEREEDRGVNRRIDNADESVANELNKTLRRKKRKTF